MRIGLVGLGNVGQDLAGRLAAGAVPGAELWAVTHTDLGVAEERTGHLQPPPQVLPLDDLVAECDAIVETATAAALPTIARSVLRAGKTFLPISVAGLLALPDLELLARAHGGRVIVPSGTLPGLDLVRAAREGRITKASLTSRVRPESLEQEPYIVDAGIDLHPSGGAAVMIFAGSAREAAQRFPRHFNVAVALSLAGAGLERTQVEVWSDPGIGGAQHRIQVESDDVSLDLTSRNIPSDVNPRTSRIVTLSVIAALRSLIEPVRVGS